MKRRPAKNFQDLCYLILAKDLGYGNIPMTSGLMSQLEQVSKLLEAYTTSILDSGSRFLTPKQLR